MRFTASLSVERPHGEPSALWPPGLRHLVVVVERPHDRGGKLVVYGIDPDRKHVVFEATIRPGQLGAFFKAVADGSHCSHDHSKPMTAASTATLSFASAAGDGGDGGPEETVVVITNPGGDTGGPKIAAEIGATTAGALGVANAASPPY
jgi:hypothetical protein